MTLIELTYESVKLGLLLWAGISFAVIGQWFVIAKCDRKQGIWREE